MPSFSDVAVPAIVTIVLIVLSIRQRACWRRAAAQLAPGRVAASRARWLATAACLAIAAALCGTALTLTAAAPARGRGDRAIVLAVDVSRSMHAQDVSPSRLHAAKDVLRRAVEHADGSRLAIVAFAGDAALTCPLTTDYEAVRSAIAMLDVDATSTAGTSIDAGLAEALETVRGDAGRAAVVLVSDGESFGSSAADAVSRARALGVPIHVLATGTVAGAPVPAHAGPGAAGRLPQGVDVPVTRLDEPFLRRLAEDTGGRYLSVTTEDAVVHETLFDLREGRAATSVGAPSPSRPNTVRGLMLVALVLLSAATLLAPPRT